MKKCAFFGHRNIEINEDLEYRLNEEISNLITNGCDCFYFGGLGEFDNLCWQLVTKSKAFHPEIRRIFCLYNPRHLQKNKRPKFLKDEDYEQFIYFDLKFDYWYSRIYFRNCEIIKQSDFVVFYAFENENSGAYKTYKFALKLKKKCINLAQKN